MTSNDHSRDAEKPVQPPRPPLAPSFEDLVPENDLEGETTKKDKGKAVDVYSTAQDRAASLQATDPNSSNAPPNRPPSIAASQPEVQIGHASKDPQGGGKDRSPPSQGSGLGLPVFSRYRGREEDPEKGLGQGSSSYPHVVAAEKDDIYSASGDQRPRRSTVGSGNEHVSADGIGEEDRAGRTTVPPNETPGGQLEFEYGPELERWTGEQTVQIPFNSKIDRLKRSCCEQFRISIMGFYIEERERRALVRQSVYDVLYRLGPRTIQELVKKKVGTSKEPDFTWYHIPANNIAWVEHLILRLRAEKLANESASNQYMDTLVQENLRLSQPGDFSFLKPEFREPEISGGNTAGAATQGAITVVLPYLSCEKYGNVCEMKKTIKMRRERTQDPVSSCSHLGVNADPSHNECRSKMMHRDLIFAHGSGDGFQPRRSLHEYKYFNVGNTDERDAEQVFYKSMKSHRMQSKSDDCKLFMVDQLWMWVLGEDTIITCLPAQWDAIHFEGFEDKHREMMDPHRRFLNYLYNIPCRPPIVSAYCLAIEVMTACVDLLRGLDPLLMQHGPVDFFHKSTVSLSAKVGPSLAKMRVCVLRGELSSISEDLALLVDVSDMIDELEIVCEVLTDQWRILEKYNSEMHWLRLIRASLYDEPEYPDVSLSSLTHHLDQVRDMMKLAETTKKKLNNILNWKQQHNSLLQARATAKQGSSIMLFTMLTIIFLPISFMAAFFAIPTDGFKQINDKIPFDYVLKYLLSIGLALSLPFIILALNLDRAVRFVNKARDGMHRLQHLHRYLVVLLATVLFTALMAAIWAAGLSAGVKVSVTMVLVVAAVGGIFASGFNHGSTMVVK